MLRFLNLVRFGTCGIVWDVFAVRTIVLVGQPPLIALMASPLTQARFMVLVAMNSILRCPVPLTSWCLSLVLEIGLVKLQQPLTPLVWLSVLGFPASIAALILVWIVHSVVDMFVGLEFTTTTSGTGKFLPGRTPS